MMFFINKVNGATLIGSVLMWFLVCNNLNTMVLAMPRSKEYHTPNIASNTGGEVVNSKLDTEINSEPSCEELKAMWRFSKRQSRAAEVTNEIPTYKDPFSNNIWESYYPRTRGGTRFRNRPVYGRVIHKPPDRDRKIFQVLTEQYGELDVPRPRLTAFRLGGGGSGLHVPVTTHGSFQHLKELIRTERARELQEQRLAEEAAARAVAFKQFTGGYRPRNKQVNMHNIPYSHIGIDDSIETDPTRELPSQFTGVLAFPDILARAVRLDNDNKDFLLEQHFGPQDEFRRPQLYYDGLDSRLT